MGRSLASSSVNLGIGPYKMAATHTLWDPSLFTRSLKVIGVQIQSEKTSGWLKVLSRDLLKKRNFKPVHSPSPTTRLLYLDPIAFPNVQSILDNPVLGGLVKAENAELKELAVDVNYESYGLDEALRIVLPSDIPEIPSAFETIGHIAHLNLKAWHLPYKHIIGQMILDKTHGIRTVLNKTDMIQNQFRVFPMEVLAGENDLNVEILESQCQFRFNYGKVYWNSRLQAEHNRLVREILKRSSPIIVADMMAGVGPFSIPLAKSRAMVYANDLNPDSYHYLVANASLNKLKEKHVASNLDGREFMVDLVRHKSILPTDVIMNLPASATDFLDVFKGLYTEATTTDKLPFIHCYTFAEDEGFEISILSRVEAMLGVKVHNPHIHNVRNIAPKKNMFCISFPLPPEIERVQPQADSAAEQPPATKKAKLL